MTHIGHTTTMYLLNFYITAGEIIILLQSPVYVIYSAYGVNITNCEARMYTPGFVIAFCLIVTVVTKDIFIWAKILVYCINILANTPVNSLIT